MNNSVLSNNDECTSRRSLIVSGLNENGSVVSRGSASRDFIAETYGDRKSLMREESKTLVNHNSLITKFHDFVITNKSASHGPSSGQATTKSAVSVGAGGQQITNLSGILKIPSIFKKTPSQSKLSNYSPSKNPNLGSGSSNNNSFERAAGSSELIE